MEKAYDIIIQPDTPKIRLDIFLSKHIGISRSQIEKLIHDGFVRLNHQVPKPSYKVKTEDRIIVNIPPPKEIKAIPEKIPLNIVYEDKDIIVLNKPRGIVVHPAAGNTAGTLVNALLYHCKDLSGIGGNIRPGVVHRLDKDTSGLIIFAKTDEAHLDLTKQIKDRKVKKTYLALVHGEVENKSGVINEPLGRSPRDRKKIAVIRSEKLKKREAITQYRVLKTYPGYSLLELDLKTGRTHQIRVHLSHIGYPIVGDMTYSKKKNEFGVTGQLLHAKKLGFNHPITGRYLEFEAELPEDFERVLRFLVKNKAGDNTKKQ